MKSNVLKYWCYPIRGDPPSCAICRTLIDDGMLHLLFVLSGWAGRGAACMGVEGCVPVQEPAGRADRLSLLLSWSAYDKAHVFIWLPRGQLFFSCLIQIAAFVLQASFNLPLLPQQLSPVILLQPSFQLTPLWRPAVIQAAFSLPEQRPWGNPSALHPSSHCLPLSRRSESGTLRIASLQSLSSMLWIAWFWT